MAVNLLGREVSELCLGKPPLRPLSLHVTAAEALSALKRLGESCLSVWSCHCSSASATATADCRCVGKISVADFVCFLARPENLSSPAAALQTPISDLIPKSSGLVRHLDSDASLVEAIDAILEGAQRLVIPIKASSSRHKNSKCYCWITEEDIIRHLFNSIGLFSPTPASPIAALPGLVGPRFLALGYHEPPLPLVSLAVATHTTVAVVDDQGRLVGEISPFTLNCSDETVPAALATLSTRDLLAYIDCGGPPDDLVQVVKDRLEERGCGAFFDFVVEEAGGCLSMMSSSSSLCSSSSSLSSSEEEEFGRSSGRLGGVRRCEPMVCHAGSSMVAVMIQALVHRSGCVWVVDEDGVLSGVVTFAGMLKVFRERLNCM